MQATRISAQTTNAYLRPARPTRTTAGSLTLAPAAPSAKLPGWHHEPHASQHRGDEQRGQLVRAHVFNRVAYQAHTLAERLPVAVATVVDNAVSTLIDRHRWMPYLLIFVFVVSVSGLALQVSALDLEATHEAAEGLAAGASEWLGKQSEGEAMPMLPPLLDTIADAAFAFLDLVVWGWVARLSWLAHAQLLRSFMPGSGIGSSGGGSDGGRGNGAGSSRGAPAAAAVASSGSSGGGDSRSAFESSAHVRGSSAGGHGGPSSSSSSGSSGSSTQAAASASGAQADGALPTTTSRGAVEPQAVSASPLLQHEPPLVPPLPQQQQAAEAPTPQQDQDRQQQPSAEPSPLLGQQPLPTPSPGPSSSCASPSPQEPPALSLSSKQQQQQQQQQPLPSASSAKQEPPTLSPAQQQQQPLPSPSSAKQQPPTPSPFPSPAKQQLPTPSLSTAPQQQQQQQQSPTPSPSPSPSPAQQQQQQQLPASFWYATLAVRFILLINIDAVAILLRNFSAMYWGFLLGQYRGAMLALGPAELAVRVVPVFVVDIVLWLVQDLFDGLLIAGVNAVMSTVALVLMYEFVVRGRRGGLQDYAVTGGM